MKETIEEKILEICTSKAVSSGAGAESLKKEENENLSMTELLSIFELGSA